MKHTLPRPWALYGLAVVVGVSLLCVLWWLLHPDGEGVLLRNGQRREDMGRVRDAVILYLTLHPQGISFPVGEDCRDDFGMGEWCGLGGEACEGRIDVSVLVPWYLTGIPRDPLLLPGAATGYRMVQLPSGSITVCSDLWEYTLTERVRMFMQSMWP